MTLTTTAHLSATFLLLLPWVSIQADLCGYSNITLTVFDSLSDSANLTFGTQVACNGSLLGAMSRLEKQQNSGFKFTFKENLDYGPYLESVNGISGNTTLQTYWEILVESADTLFRAHLGIGCFIPKPNDHIILKFTKW